VFAITSFDLWMSKQVHDIFALVINFLGKDRVPKHITIGLFETFEILDQVLAKNLQDLLEQYGFTKKKLLMLKMKD
jgi:hypothetical protein